MVGGGGVYEHGTEIGTRCQISRIFSTALEVKQLEDGRLVGNELECAMVRRMGGLEKSEAQNLSLESQREPSLVWLV